MNLPRRRLSDARVLIYSHDTFGLGHLRRCRALAHELVGRFKGISVLILSGSPVIGSFEFRARVDFVRMPGVIKLKDGSYTSLKLHIDLRQTMAIRESIIMQTAAAFLPDLFLVDKEPLGLEGEVHNTLKNLRARGTRTVLGLRDVLDGVDALQKEWARKSAPAALQDLYDEIWIYGTEEFYHPLRGLDLPNEVLDKTIFTGYLRRVATDDDTAADIAQPYILISPGGGKDGEAMVDRVLQTLPRAKLHAAAVVVLGPFMDEPQRAKFRARAADMPNTLVLDYHPRLENLLANAAGVIAMGGYNTFCEILSFNKPALIIPRITPRTEQLIRARRAAELGLVTIVEPDRANVENLLPLIKNLTAQPNPKPRIPDGMLNGMECVSGRVLTLLDS